MPRGELGAVLRAAAAAAAGAAAAAWRCSAGGTIDLRKRGCGVTHHTPSPPPPVRVPRGSP